jgi:hypothetical protein
MVTIGSKPLLSPSALAALADEKEDDETTKSKLPVWATPKGRRRLFGTTNRKLDSDVDEEELFEKDVMAELIIKYQLTNTKRRHKIHAKMMMQKRKGEPKLVLDGIAPPPLFVSANDKDKDKAIAIAIIAAPPLVTVADPAEVEAVAAPPLAYPAAEAEAIIADAPPPFTRNDRWMAGRPTSSLR